MASFDLFIDTDRCEPVIGPSDSSVAVLPLFVQGDTIKLRVWLLKGFSQLDSFDEIPVAGVTLQMAIGTKVGNATIYYTQQFTWTASEDLGQPYFSGTLPMNTAAIDGLLDSDAKATAFLEVKMIVDATPTTVLSKQITVQAAVIKPDTLVVPVPLTPLSAESANATYTKVIHVGHRYLMNANGYGIDEWVDTDGVLHQDPVTP